MSEAGSFPPANPWRRLVCLLYDTLLLLGILAVAFLLPNLALGMGFGVVLPGSVLFFHAWLVTGAYFVGYWSRHGQTLAMQTWHLRIVDANGATPAFKQLLLRFVLGAPSLLAYGAGFFWAIVDRERLFLHERLSGTRLIVAPPTTTTTQPPTGT